MSKKVIIGLVGDLAAGKGLLTAYLKEKYGVNGYRFSTILRDILDRLYLPQQRDFQQKLSTLLRENFSQDILGRIIAEDVKHDPNDLVLVDGIRRASDITYLSQLPGFSLVYLTADPKIRWERLIARDENPGDAQKTFEQFLQDEQTEADRTIKATGATAKYTLENNGTVEEIQQKIDELVQKLKNNV